MAVRQLAHWDAVVSFADVNGHVCPALDVYDCTAAHRVQLRQGARAICCTAVLQALSLALPASGPTTTMVATDSIAEYGQTLSRLIAGTLQGSHFAQSSCSPSSEDLQRTQAGIGQGAASRWQHAAALAADYEQPTQPHGAEQIAAAFSSLLADAVTSEEVQTTRWCCTLVLARQLGTSLAGLMNSLNQLLLVIPGKQQQSSATVAEVPIGHAAEAEV